MTDITPQQAFEDLIKDRIRDDIGKLMPDEALQKIIEKAIEGAFFTQRITKEGSWHERVEPSWVEKHIRSLLEAQVRAHVDKWFQDNRERMSEIIETGIKETMPGMLVKLLEGFWDAKLYSFQANLQSLMHRS